MAAGPPREAAEQPGKEVIAAAASIAVEPPG